jgi:hypothetical protein
MQLLALRGHDWTPSSIIVQNCQAAGGLHGCEALMFPTNWGLHYSTWLCPRSAYLPGLFLGEFSIRLRIGLLRFLIDPSCYSSLGVNTGHSPNA